MAVVSLKKTLLKSVRRYLYQKYGPLLLYPAYSHPDESIGYLSRYAPGLRENGGLYTHAANWALQMECKLKNPERAWAILKQINPINRGREPDLYRAEPYVLPGNVDGPQSPYFGRGGWTWYTGSAAWLFKIITEWLLGVRPDWDGLIVDPCLPSSWKGFKMVRRSRQTTY